VSTGVLLVGGASTRFGSPKALAAIDGETLAERGWRILGEACDERLAVGKRGDGLTLPFPLIEDAAPVRAALSGIVAGLRAAAHPVVVFLPVDAPFVTPESLRTLAARCADAAVAQAGPLPCALARGTLAVLERRLAAGELRLRDVLAELETATVRLDPRELANVNTPDDLRRSPVPGS
jgi:molybdopterin-guanine dinucleotide biosynthesis protein A